MNHGRGTSRTEQPRRRPCARGTDSCPCAWPSPPDSRGLSDAGVATGIDHVQLFVTDQAAVAAWDERVLGVTPDPAFAE
jgi:hypothetical protein